MITIVLAALLAVQDALPGDYQVRGSALFAGDLRVAALPKTDRASIDAAVAACEKARTDWEAHRAFLPADTRDAWTRIARSLEDARRSHPAHLGILQDLITAYGQVLSFEKRTARALNIGLLLPDLLREFEASGDLEPREATFVRKARASLYLKQGLYPLAARHLRADDDEDKALLAVLAALKADKWDAGASLKVEAKVATVEVDVYASSAALEGQALRFFIPRNGTVWYTLTRQTSRYFLVGWVAGQPKLLKLYGADEPGADTVARDVREQLTAALGGAP